MPWDMASDRTQRFHIRKVKQVVHAALGEIASQDAEKLWISLVQSKVAAQQTNDEATDFKLADALAECYKNAAHWGSRRQILSIMADKMDFETLQNWLPGLTRYRFKIDRKAPSGLSWPRFCCLYCFFQKNVCVTKTAWPLSWLYNQRPHCARLAIWWENAQVIYERRDCSAKRNQNINHRVNSAAVQCVFSWVRLRTYGMQYTTRNFKCLLGVHKKLASGAWLFYCTRSKSFWRPRGCSWRNWQKVWKGFSLG